MTEIDARPFPEAPPECDPVDDDLATRAAYAIVCVGRQWVARADEVLAKSGLAGGHLAVLLLLKDNPSGLTQRELAGRLALAESSLSRRTGELLSRGLICSSRLIGDRRANLLRLTPTGQDWLAQWGGYVEQQRRSAVAGLSRGEVALVLDVLARLDKNLQSHACSRDAVIGVAPD